MRAAAANKLYADITEAAFTKQVIDLARWYRWRVAHFRVGMNRRGRYMTPVQGDGAGFPDLVLVRGDRVVVAELKARNGTISSEQDKWLCAFKIAGIETYLWKPENFEQIETCLE